MRKAISSHGKTEGKTSAQLLDRAPCRCLRALWGGAAAAGEAGGATEKLKDETIQTELKEKSGDLASDAAAGEAGGANEELREEAIQT